MARKSRAASALANCQTVERAKRLIGRRMKAMNNKHVHVSGQPIPPELPPVPIGAPPEQEPEAPPHPPEPAPFERPLPDTEPSTVPPPKA